MMIRALVAKMDGVPDITGSALAPGSITPATVPVTTDFDRRRPPIGTAALVVEGTDVFAEIDLFNQDDIDLAGKFPALGFFAAAVRRDSICDIVTNGEIREVSICAAPNTDFRIPAIK